MRKAISLIEALIAIAIMGLLLSMILVAVQSVRATASRTDCQNRLHQLGVGTQSYLSCNGTFPHGAYFRTASQSSEIVPHRDIGLAWTKLLLPQIELRELYNQVLQAYKNDNQDRSEMHYNLASVVVSHYRCASDSRQYGEFRMPNNANVIVQLPLPSNWALINYLGVTGTANTINGNGMLPINRAVKPSEVTDGTSHTLLIGERPTQPDGRSSGWYNYIGHLSIQNSQLLPISRSYANLVPPDTICPSQEIGAFQRGKYNDLCSMYHFWSLHPGGANFAFADGSVRFITYAAEPILPALATRAGGETVDWD